MARVYIPPHTNSVGCQRGKSNVAEIDNDELEATGDDGRLEPNQEHDGRAFLIVGLGASAGGLEALDEFFDETPPDADMAFIVVMHLATGGVSMLPEIIARHTKMPVVRVEDNTEIEANHVYLPPPGVTLGVSNGRLHLFEPPADG